MHQAIELLHFIPEVEGNSLKCIKELLGWATAPFPVWNLRNRIIHSLLTALAIELLPFIPGEVNTRKCKCVEGHCRWTTRLRRFWNLRTPRTHPTLLTALAI